MLRSSEELRDMAAECHALAEAAKTPIIREQLLELADQFERLSAFDQTRSPMLGQQHY